MLRMVKTSGPRSNYGHMYSQFPEDYQSTISAAQAEFIANPSLTLAQLAQKYPEIAQSDLQATMNAAVSSGLAPAQPTTVAPATTIPLTVATATSTVAPTVTYDPTTGQPIYTYPTTAPLPVVTPTTIFGMSIGGAVLVFGALGIGGFILLKVLKRKGEI